MRYYKCVDCGYRGDFKFERERNVKCQICSYDMLVEYTEKEHKDWMDKFGKYQKENPFYKTKGRLNAFGKPASQIDVMDAPSKGRRKK